MAHQTEISPLKLAVVHLGGSELLQSYDTGATCNSYRMQFRRQIYIHIHCKLCKRPGAFEPRVCVCDGTIYGKKHFGRVIGSDVTVVFLKIMITVVVAVIDISCVKNCCGVNVSKINNNNTHLFGKIKLLKGWKWQTTLTTQPRKYLTS